MELVIHVELLTINPSLVHKKFCLVNSSSASSDGCPWTNIRFPLRPKLIVHFLDPIRHPLDCLFQKTIILEATFSSVYPSFRYEIEIHNCYSPYTILDAPK